MRRLLSERDFTGNMAKFAVTQHPYSKPPRLDEVTQCLIEACAKNFDIGAAFHRMKWFDDAKQVRDWLRAALEDATEILLLWNTRANGNQSPIGFTSRYYTPNAEDDFIDIDALIGNVARAAWEDAAEYEEKAA